MTTRIQRLGEQMAERRKRLGLSQSAAARAAGVSRTAWVAWENDASRPEDFNHVKIETVLRWRAASVAAALAGRKALAGPERPDLLDETEEAIWAITELDEPVRMRYIQRHRQRRTDGSVHRSRG